MEKYELEDLEYHISKMSDPELLVASTTNKERYIPEAQFIIKKELKKRNDYKKEHNPIFRKASTDLFKYGFEKINDNSKFKNKSIKYYIAIISILFGSFAPRIIEIFNINIRETYLQVFFGTIGITYILLIIIYFVFLHKHFYKRRICPNCRNQMLRVSPELDEKQYSYKFICDKCKLFIDTGIYISDEQIEVSYKKLFKFIKTKLFL